MKLSDKNKRKIYKLKKLKINQNKILYIIITYIRYIEINKQFFYEEEELENGQVTIITESDLS